MSYKSEEEFSSLIKKHFGFLIDEYDFILKTKSADYFDTDIYDFESSTARIRIFIERKMLVVGIIPVGEEDRKLRRSNIIPTQLGLSVVAKGLNPNLDYETIWNEPVLSAMERKSQILKNHCKDILAGDFTSWVDILENIRKRN